MLQVRGRQGRKRRPSAEAPCVFHAGQRVQRPCLRERAFGARPSPGSGGDGVVRVHRTPRNPRVRQMRGIVHRALSDRPRRGDRSAIGCGPCMIARSSIDPIRGTASSLERFPEIVRAYIEIVPTDGVKYEIDKHSGYLKVDRPQRFSNFCPTLYGFVPQTYCGDKWRRIRWPVAPTSRTATATPWTYVC